jgi:hypothetical protein
MFRSGRTTTALAWLVILTIPNPGRAADPELAPHSLGTPEQVFAPVEQTSYCASDDCLGTAPSPQARTASESCSIADLFACDGWLTSDETLLHDFQKQEFATDWTYSVGGALRWRYLDEANRLRPPLTAGRSTYQQWRFTPYMELSYAKRITGYAQIIDATTFGEDLPIVPIDVNRWDMLQLYADLKVFEFESGDLHYRYGRQLITLGAQRLVSPLAWANTYRNFQGHRLYYSDDAWNFDAIAVQALNGASRNVVYNIDSYDHPNDAQWLGGVYVTNKQIEDVTIDLYWLWSSADSPTVNVLNGDRHTVGARWGGERAISDLAPWTLNWDMEGAYQFGTASVFPVPDQDLSAGFVSRTAGGLTFDEAFWTPTVTGLLYWGSGDSDPLGGTNHTFSTLYPLGHAYWGMIDNFNGSNLIDYSLQLDVKPVDKLKLLSAWHWFDKAAPEDGIYNIAGVPFGGITPTARHLGTELDLMATYQVNKNLQLQAGYFWFWYGPAITQNPNPLVANRGDAEQIYISADWTF